MAMESMEKLCEQLDTLLKEKKHREFAELASTISPVDLADFLSELEDEELVTAFRLLKKDAAADAFAELDSDVQEKIILTTTDTRLAQILDDLSVDDAVDCLQELPASMVKRILRVAKPDTRAEINKFLSYPEDSAGSIMTAEFLSVRENFTVAQAVEHIRGTGINKETVYVAYITDDKSMLRGIVSLRSLLFADANSYIRDIMTTEVVSATTTDDKESVAATISRYDFLALPIVDKEGRLVGIVTVDDALDVLEDEATEDIEMMAAISPSDKPYLKTSVWETWKKRVPWLLLLMVSATFTGSIISHYEAALGAYVILTSFIPMLMDSGGNAGGQASVTIIRGLSLGEISMKNILRVVLKELRVAALCGGTLCVVNFFKVMLLDFRCAFTPQNFLVAGIVSATLFCTIVVANIIGSSLPILAKRLGFDPAVMASPFITTVVDAVSLVIYFRFATMFLGV